jgi:protein-tyrosine phosphatase
MKKRSFLIMIWAIVITGVTYSQSQTLDLGLTLAPGESLGITSVPNLRDAGGYTSRDGAVVRRGLAYRSSGLNPISPDDAEKIARLGLKTVFDLRTAEEVNARPDELPSGTKRVWLNVLADADASGPALLGKLLRDPQEANSVLGGGKVEAMFEQSYRDFVSLPSARKAYRELFVALGQPDQLPAVYHCSTGKDRTGWASAALLTLLGVPRDKVVEDFLRSNDYILPAVTRQIDAFVAAGGERSIMLAIFGVRKQYLDASVDEMQKRYGTIENYFAEGLGIDAAGQKALRDLYLRATSRAITAP